MRPAGRSARMLRRVAVDVIGGLLAATGVLVTGACGSDSSVPPTGQEVVAGFLVGPADDAL